MPVSEFHWIQKGLLAGSGMPGLFNTLEEDVTFLKREGIGLIVTLTENPLAPDPADFGIPTLHFPIPDMCFPIPSAARDLCDSILARFRENTAVLVHCYAGLGRTGTILACCLVSQGMSAEPALTRIRRICPQYVQTSGQENFITHFAMINETIDTTK